MVADLKRRRTTPNEVLKQLENELAEATKRRGYIKIMYFNKTIEEQYESSYSITTLMKLINSYKETK